jgi:hypothetical protein
MAYSTSGAGPLLPALLPANRQGLLDQAWFGFGTLGVGYVKKSLERVERLYM